MRKIMLFILGLILNMVPALAEDEGYSARFVSLGHQSAVVYQPTLKSAKAGIGIVVMHSDEDYMGFIPNPELSKRGYTVIATVPTQGKVIGEKLLNIKACVEYLRKDPNINSPIGNIEGVTVPSLFMGMTGSYEYLAAEEIYNHSASTDKTIALVEGAGHNFTPERESEKYNKTSYGDTVKKLFDYVDNWLNERFN